jgi:uncharacterized protein (TIRG00374 family)
VQASRSPNVNKLSWIIKVGFILLFLYFVSRANIVTLFESLRGVHLVPFMLAFLVLPAFVCAKAVRWGVILNDMGVQPPGIWRLCIYYTIGLFLGGVTPGQFGDIAKGWYIRSERLPLQTAMLSVVVDRLCDMLIMALLGGIAIFDFADLLPPQLFLVAQIGILFLAIGSGLLVSQRFRNWLAVLLDRTVLQRLRVSQFVGFQFSAFSRSWLVLLSFTLLSIACNVLRSWLLFEAGNIDIPFFSVFAVITLIAIFQILPISIAGFGVRESLLILVLQSYGYGIEAALLLSLLLFLLNIQQIVIGFCVSLFYPLQMER